MSQPLVFVVEDDRELSMVFAHAFQAAGYITELFHDGQKALDRLAVDAPYLVLLDLHLPGVPGPQILDFIRAQPRLSQIRVIVASADATLSTDHTIEKQADFVLIKPVRFAHLQRLAERLFPAGD